jgi:hypothetical protein
VIGHRQAVSPILAPGTGTPYKFQTSNMSFR